MIMLHPWARSQVLLMALVVVNLLVGRAPTPSSAAFVGDGLRNKLQHLQRAEYWEAVGAILFPSAASAAAVAPPSPPLPKARDPTLSVLLDAGLGLGLGLTHQKMSSAFPGALSNRELVRRLEAALGPRGFRPDSTLLATSLCCDELNRVLEEDLCRSFGDSAGAYFRLGGLAGFPFAGTTGFVAMSSHVPDGGACLVVYGPHCGIDSKGTVGTVPRRGKRRGGACCGSAAVAAQHILRSSRPRPPLAETADLLDFQQSVVVSKLLPYAERVRSAPDPMEEVPFCLYEAQDEMIRTILERCRPNAEARFPIALLGGIEINTPSSDPDYFVPLRFDLYKGGIVDEPLDLLPEIVRRSRLMP